MGFVLRLLFCVSMFFAMFIVVGLCGFHCYLSATNQTTYEMVKPHILEKWIKEESKRKKRYHPKKHAYAAVDISEDTDTEVSDVESKYKRSVKENNMISFDEGCCKNLWMFWTARLKTEWMIPFRCRLSEVHSDDLRYSDH